MICAGDFISEYCIQTLHGTNLGQGIFAFYLLRSQTSGSRLPQGTAGDACRLWCRPPWSAAHRCCSPRSIFRSAGRRAPRHSNFPRTTYAASTRHGCSTKLRGAGVLRFQSCTAGRTGRLRAPCPIRVRPSEPLFHAAREFPCRPAHRCSFCPRRSSPRLRSRPE